MNSLLYLIGPPALARIIMQVDVGPGLARSAAGSVRALRSRRLAYEGALAVKAFGA